MTRLDELQLADLLRQGMAGDAKSYRQFLGETARIVRGIVNAKAGMVPVEDKEDIVQEVMLAIHSKRGTWQQDRPLKPWLYAIARYKIVDLFRKRGTRKFVDIDEFSESLAAEENEPAVMDRDIETMLCSLSGKQESIVRSICIDGRSIAETAAHFGMKETAVRVNFHRGLEKLRQNAREMEEV